MVVILMAGVGGVEYSLGNYKKLNPEHRCSSGLTSTTKHWFGLKMDDV